jgi:hypothetical protein
MELKLLCLNIFLNKISSFIEYVKQGNFISERHLLAFFEKQNSQNSIG